MGFDGDDDWALSGEAWELILAAADQVLDDYRADLESLQAGTEAFRDTAMFQQLPPLHVARYDAAFAEAFLTATDGVATKLHRAHEEAWPYPTEALLGFCRGRTRHGGHSCRSRAPSRPSTGQPCSHPLPPGRAHGRDRGPPGGQLQGPGLRVPV